MGIMKWAESKFQKFNVWDIGVFKLSLVLFGLALGSYFNAFISANVVYFWVAFGVGYVYLMYRMLK